jgi:hypothetical protein
LFDKVRSLGGVTGFAHQGMSFHGYRGMTLNVLRGKVDFLELAQFCVAQGPLALDHYYHFLDLGYKLTALAGSDFPWCGRGPSYGFSEPQFAHRQRALLYVCWRAVVVRALVRSGESGAHVRNHRSDRVSESE